MPTLFDMFRGAAVADKAYQESGVSGVAQAFKNATPFEEMGRDDKYKKAYAPLVQGIEESLAAGDADTAVTQVLSLRKQMTANNARPADIQRFAGGYFQQALQTGFNSKPLDQPEGQNFALKGSAISNPAQASDVAVQGAQLGAQRMAPAVAQANIDQSKAATDVSRVTASQVLPQQVAESQARTRAYDRGEIGKGGRGSRMDSMFRGNANVINQMDKQILGYFKPQAGGKDVNLDTARQQAEAQLQARNFTARSLGMPEAELTPIFETGPITTKDSRDMAASGPLTTYALRPKQESAGNGAPPPGAQGAEAPPALGGMPQAPPLSAVDAMAGTPGAPQGRPDFQAAVQNPLGALPPQVQQAIQNPGTPVAASAIVQAYVGQGFSEQAANYLTDRLFDMVTNAPPPQQGQRQELTRDPFQQPQF